MKSAHIATWLLLLLIVATRVPVDGQEEAADPSVLCKRSPERPECALFFEMHRTDSEASQIPKSPTRRARPTPSPRPTPAPTPDPDVCATADEAESRLAGDTGSTTPPSRICPCERAQGRVKSHLRDPSDDSDRARVIEVCDTGTEYRLDGLLVIPKDPDHPAFAQAALDDLGVIGSISDPSGHVGFEFLSRLLHTLGEAALPAEDRGVYVRWGAAPNRAEPARVGAFTRPGTSGHRAADEEWRDATARGLDVYDSDGVPVGGRMQYFGGLLKGTGVGIGSSVFYEPEMLPDPGICPSGSTSDVALLHELEHAARMALGQVDNTPYPNLWLNRDPLAAQYGVHEEKFVVERENEYRAALEQRYPRRYPNLRPRKGYLDDC